MKVTTGLWFRVLGIVCLGCIGGMLSGCEEPLFAPTQPRTPYERYQELHGEARPSTEQNSYGGDEPALRERLKPLEDP
jgi:hypothetical protein